MYGIVLAHTGVSGESALVGQRVDKTGFGPAYECGFDLARLRQRHSRSQVHGCTYYPGGTIPLRLN